MNQKQKSKKTYTPPKLIEHGSVASLTQNKSTGVEADMGAFPGDKKDTGPPPMDMCISTVSQLEEHRFLLEDIDVQKQFLEAIRQTVKPGDVVLDLGSGTGLHAFFAAQAGAKKVYAIEADTLVEVSKQAARDNGLEDKVEFLFGLAADVELPEKVDVIITNIGFMNTVRELPRAIDRFLKPNGKVIPQEIFLSFVPIEVLGNYGDKVDFWKKNHFGFDFSAFRPYAAQFPHYLDSSEDQFLADPQDLEAFDWSSSKRSFKWNVSYRAKKSGFITGFLGWYTFMLTNQHSFSTKPPLEISKDIWAQPLLPLETPVPIKDGQEINTEFQLHLDADSTDPIWVWNLEVDGKTYLQTNFNSIPLNRDFLAKLK